MWTIPSAYNEAFAAAKANAAQVRVMAEFRLQSYVQRMPGETRASVGIRLAECYRERLAAVPDLTVYPELRGMPEFLKAEWRGARDGAELDDAQAAAHVMGNWLLHREAFSKQTRQQAHCSVVYFHTSDHGALLGVNLDTHPSEPYDPPRWMPLSEHLVMGGVSSGVFLDEESPEIFPAPVYRLMGRYCRTTEEAVELLTRYNYFWGPCNRLVVDRRGHVAMIEKSACRIGVRWSHDGFGFVTAMTAEEPNMHAYLTERRAASLEARGLPNPCADTRYWAAQDTRRTIMNRLVNEAKQAPTLEKMRALMQYRGQDGVVCDNGDILCPGDPPIEYTIKMEICCLSEARTLWWTRDNERQTPSWQHPMPEVAFTNVLRWP